MIHIYFQVKKYQTVCVQIFYFNTEVTDTYNIDV